MSFKNVDNIIIENAQILYKNFSGSVTKYNRVGRREFNVIIDDSEQAQKLAEDGWNISILRPRDPEDEPKHKLPVEVRFNMFPPKVYLVTKKGITELDEESIGTLDYAEIKTIDLTIRPRPWTDDEGNERIKAYLKIMYVTIEEDEFADKYSDKRDLKDDLPF